MPLEPLVIWEGKALTKAQFESKIGLSGDDLEVAWEAACTMGGVMYRDSDVKAELRGRRKRKLKPVMKPVQLYPKLYRIRHKATGKFYKPPKFKKTNDGKYVACSLSPSGKVYDRIPNFANFKEFHDGSGVAQPFNPDDWEIQLLVVRSTEIVTDGSR